MPVSLARNLHVLKHNIVDHLYLNLKKKERKSGRLPPEKLLNKEVLVSPVESVWKIS